MSSLLYDTYEAMILCTFCALWHSWAVRDCLFLIQRGRRLVLGLLACWRRVWPTFKGAVLFLAMGSTVAEILLDTTVQLLCWQVAAVALACCPCSIMHIWTMTVCDICWLVSLQICLQYRCLESRLDSGWYLGEINKEKCHRREKVTKAEKCSVYAFGNYKISSYCLQY